MTGAQRIDECANSNSNKKTVHVGLEWPVVSDGPIRC